MANASTYPPRNLVIVDWSRGGHSAMYLERILTALEDKCERILVFSPHEKELVAFAEKTPSLAECCIFHPIRRASGGSRWVPRRLSRRMAAWRSGRKTRSEIRRNFGKSARTGVFFPCLTDWESIYYRWFCTGLGLPWTALILSFKAMRIKDADFSLLDNLNARQCRGVLTLDENRVDWLAERMPGKTVAFLPDVSDLATDENNGLARDLRERAKGRKVVLLIGRLRPVKGVVTFARMALEAGGDDLFFALVGQLEPNDFDPRERELLYERFLKQDYCYGHFEALRNEEEYNAVFRLASVVCVAYRNFLFSSNSLTKAAFFGIPVVVGKGHLLEERVREYQTGEVVNENEPKAVLRAVRRLSAEGDQERAPDWQSFRERFSEESFRRCLGDFIEKTFPVRQ